MCYYILNAVYKRKEGSVMEYYLNAGCWGDVFAVPGAVVDDYIKLASGSAVKVLLYILRKNGKSLSSTEIAAALKINEDDVKDAFNFWEDLGILGNVPSENSHVKRDEKRESRASDTSEEASSKSAEHMETVTVRKASAPAVQTSSASFQRTPRELEQLCQSSEMKAMLDMAQQTLGTTINHTMMRSIIWQHEYLGLKPEVILMLLSYCSSIGKTSTGYIDAIAVDWSQNEINTPLKAEDEIARRSAVHTFTAKMMSAFGLKRQPTPNQQKFFDEWMLKGYSPDLIACACERTTDYGKTLTVNYVNGILENWKKKGITTREQADAESKDKKNSSGGYSGEGTSYDISKFEDFANTFSGAAKKGGNE